MSQLNLEKLTITQDFLLCEPIKEEREADGLVAPTSFEEKTQKAKVIKVGEKAKTPLGVTIIFNRYASIQIDYGGTNLLVLKDEDVIGYYLE